MSNWYFHKGKQSHRAPISFDLTFTMLDPGTILVLVQGVGAAAKMACDAIDNVKSLDLVLKNALQDLRQGIDALKSDMMVYKVLITTMQSDTNPNGPSVFETFIQESVLSAQENLLTLTTTNLQTGWTTINEKLRNSAQGCPAHARGEPGGQSLRSHEASLRKQETQKGS